MSSVFGFEQTPLSDLSDHLKGLPFSDLTNRAIFLPKVKSAFSKAPGETRRPENEITLWDWSSIVAALYKSAISGALIGFNPDAADLNWRLLSVRFDGFSFFAQSSRLPDLLSRIKLLSQILDEIRQSLEIEYPLGTEVYRDENGSIFVVPGCYKNNCDLNLLTLQGRDKKLIDQILDKSRSVVEGEIVPEINIDSQPWWGQDPLHLEKKKKGVKPDDELPPVSNHLKGVVSCPEPDWVGEQWAIQGEICTVCGLRPQGPSEKAKDRHVCVICEQRRMDRSNEWATGKLNTTIWIDELADVNGRLAMIVGNFDLSNWLSGDLVRTMTVRDPGYVFSWGEIPGTNDYKLRGYLRESYDINWVDTRFYKSADGKTISLSSGDGTHSLVLEKIGSKIHLKIDNIGTNKLKVIEEKGEQKIYDPDNAQNKTVYQVSKNPSFARLRRIWETTRGFWQDVCPTDEIKNLKESDLGKVVGLAGPRLEIRGNLRQKGGSENPGPYHAYDLTLTKGIKLSVAWDPEEAINDGSKGRLISIDNLVYFASLAGEKAPHKEKNETEWDYCSRLHSWAAKVIKELILQENQEKALKIEEPTGYGGKAKEWGEIAVESVSIIPESHYTPAIPILAEPRTFMALVPADRALDVAMAIKAKYEREMGKVRNRLPLHLGIVYAHRRTPLRAILDAGRRMLNQCARPEGWKVVCASRRLGNIDDKLPDRFSAERDGQFKEWLEILLERNGRRANWLVPAMMGDGQTLDQWYPYVFINGGEPVDRYRRFKAPNPWTGSDGWLVHAADLRPDDMVYLTPATLDFQWMDSAGRRFEISYDDRGQRRGLPRRPYLLEELETLEHIWKTLKDHLSKNQIYILRDLIETKRHEWQVGGSRSEDDVFWIFCRQALANADWKKGVPPWKEEGMDRELWLDRWADHAFRGWIADAIELHLQIMKEEV